MEYEQNIFSNRRSPLENESEYSVKILKGAVLKRHIFYSLLMHHNTAGSKNKNHLLICSHSLVSY